MSKIKVLYISNQGFNGATTALYGLIEQLLREYAITPIIVSQEQVSAVGQMLKDQWGGAIRCVHLKLCSNTWPSSGELTWPPFSGEQLRYRSILTSCPPLKWLLYAKSLCYRLIVGTAATVRLCGIIRRFRPDIVHTNVSTISVGARAAAIMGVPHVWHLREYIDRGLGLRPFPSLDGLKRSLHRRNNHCIAITDGVYAYYGLGGDSVRIYDGVFHDGPSLVREKKGCYWLCVGALNDLKGSFELLRAYRDYVAGGGKTQLWYAGAGGEDYVRAMREYIEVNALTGQVWLLGYRTDAQELMAGAGALFVPNHAEGFGFITAEAMRNHCPVVGRDEAGTKEQFDNGLKLSGGEIGIRFRDNSELVEIMSELDSLDLSEMTERAYKVVMSLYTVEKSAAAVAAYYRQVMKKRQVRQA